MSNAEEPSLVARSFRELKVILKILLLKLVPFEAIARLRESLAERAHDRAIHRLEEGTKGEAKRRNLSHRVRGRLVFAHAEADGSHPPIHHIRVELWDRDLGKPDDFLGRTDTDADGRFVIAYDPADAGANDDPDLDLRVLDVRTIYDAKGVAHEHTKVIHMVHGPNDVTEPDFDFGERKIPMWAYRDAAPLPRVALAEDATPQEFDAGRLARGITVAAESSVIRAKHVALIGAGVELTLDRVQKDYPTNLTIETDRVTPGRSRGGEWFADRAINGFNPVLLRRTDDGGFAADFSWEGIVHDRQHFVADTSVHFVRTGDELVPTRIELRHRPTGEAPGPVETFAPADGEAWQQAARVFRANWSLFGELENHLARCHFNMEQYAVAAWRNLRQNPVANLLKPHLREVVVINHRAETSLLGETGFVIEGTPLTMPAALARIVEAMGGYDWAGFSPRTAVVPGHRYARIGRVVWDVFGRYIDDYFARNDAAIREHWLEIQRFSKDLVAHAVAWRPPPAGPWVDRNELNHDDAFRAEVAGVRRAVSQVTSSAVADDEGLARLRQLCRYVLFHATFVHSWANDEQSNDGGEILYASLGLRSDIVHGDDKLGLTAYEGTTQLFFTRYLTFTKYGYLTKNEEHDVPPLLLEHLARSKADFDAVGYAASRIRARVNI